MRVLGLAGSPRRDGNTDKLLSEILRGASNSGAETKTVVLSELNIAPCESCDFCFAAGVCKINDDMQDIYKELMLADRIVLASPLHFMGLTSQTKVMVDRCQSLWAKKYKLRIPPLGDDRIRKGFFVSVGGQRLPNLFHPAIATVKSLFVSLDVEYTGELVFAGIDKAGNISLEPGALSKAYLAGQKLAES
ncbi:MAG: flavodoxin family protein [Dehalococcoidales bacterium]